MAKPMVTGAANKDTHGELAVGQCLKISLSSRLRQRARGSNAGPFCRSLQMQPDHLYLLLIGQTGECTAKGGASLGAR